MTTGESCGDAAAETPGVITMRIDDTKGRNLDPRLKGLVVVFNASPEATTIPNIPRYTRACLTSARAMAAGARGATMSRYQYPASYQIGRVPGIGASTS